MKWIKHDTDANQDAKLQNVLLDYGLEGYGLYWYCIELIAGKVDKDNITFELEHDARIIARNTGSTPQKVEEMMRYFVKLGLFENADGVITCLKLARRLDKSMTSNSEMRTLIENMRSHDGIMTKSEKHMKEENRLEENREDNKENVSTYVPTPAPKNDYTKEREEAFEYLWQTWSDCKKRIGTKNKAQKQKAKAVFMNNTFPASRVRSQIEKHGMGAFENEVDAMINLAWREHEEVYEDIQNGGRGFFPITNAHPQNFLKGVAWRE